MSGTFELDTLTKNAVLDFFATRYANGVIYCYPRPSDGIIPAATVLDPGVSACLILTKGGLPFAFGNTDNGFNFGSAAAGVLSKDSNSYSGIGLSLATMAFFRLWNNAGTSCVQGLIGPNSIMTVTTTAITIGGPVAMSSFAIDLN